MMDFLTFVWGQHSLVVKVYPSFKVVPLNPNTTLMHVFKKAALDKNVD